MDTGSGATLRSTVQKLGVFVMLASTIACWGQRLSSGQPIARPLEAASSRTLPVPGFGSYGQSQCDSRGNLYYHAAGSFKRSAILKLEHDGGQPIIFELPQDYADKTVFVAFLVTPDSHIWVLADSPEGPWIFEIGKTGDLVSHAKLSSPKGVHPEQFLAFDDGGVVLTGYFNNDAVPELRGKRYAAQFDSSGKLIKTLDTAGSDVDLAKVAQQWFCIRGFESRRIRLLTGISKRNSSCHNAAGVP